MKPIVCLVLLAATVLGALDPAPKCDYEACILENNCACSNNDIPLETEDIPQLVLLTFEDACLNDILKDYYEPLLYDRVNPDGYSISATFFIPHEYTDYDCVNKLYNRGFEIGVHSITKNFLVDYWRNADVDTLVAEFGGQKQIINQFANIPADDIQGVRAPQLQLAGDNSILAYQASALSYDSSWASRSTQKLFPYTLDYSSTQDRTSTNTPTASFPGFWISPVNNLLGNDDIECNTLLGCDKNDYEDPEDVNKWLTEEFEKAYLGDRTPFKLLVNSAWLNTIESNLKGLGLFLDHLAGLKDVFLVTESKALAWRKNPITKDSFDSNSPRRNARCQATKCQIPFGGNQNDMRYMWSCVKCPKNYPWLNNPQGL